MLSQCIFNDGKCRVCKKINYQRILFYERNRPHSYLWDYKKCAILLTVKCAEMAYFYQTSVIQVADTPFHIKGDIFVRSIKLC